MKMPAAKCRVCGLKLVERVGGWEHWFSAAGRKAERDHQAVPSSPSTTNTRRSQVDGRAGSRAGLVCGNPSPAPTSPVSGGGGPALLRGER